MAEIIAAPAVRCSRCFLEGADVVRRDNGISAHPKPMDCVGAMRAEMDSSRAVVETAVAEAEAEDAYLRAVANNKAPYTALNVMLDARAARVAAVAAYRARTPNLGAIGSRVGGGA